jgi:hypothetical protein
VSTCRCGKRSFRDEVAAMLFLATRKDGAKRRERRAYRCAFGRWHVTSKPGSGPSRRVTA